MFAIYEYYDLFCIRISLIIFHLESTLLIQVPSLKYDKFAAKVCQVCCLSYLFNLNK